jgi:hypothetical protein
MDGRHGSEEKLGRSRRLGRGVWVAYLRTGAALAILRVSVLAWVEYRSVSHQMTETVYNLLWSLRPEVLLGEYTRVGDIHFSSPIKHFLFWGPVLALGSFIIATPILVVGWLRQRRR